MNSKGPTFYVLKCFDQAACEFRPSRYEVVGKGKYFVQWARNFPACSSADIQESDQSLVGSARGPLSSRLFKISKSFFIDAERVSSD